MSGQEDMSDPASISIAETVAHIGEFAALSVRGWDSYDGDPISPQTVELAQKIAIAFRTMAPDVAPGGDGSIGFEWMLPDGDLIVFAVEATGKLEAFVSVRHAQGIAEREARR